ncbi:TPA: hypothetical protein ACOEBW_000376 [Enterobacter hormaechei subsp. xiangfangensis]
MGWDSILALLIAGAGFLVSIFRDKSSEIEKLAGRLAILETNSAHHTTDISKLEKKQEELGDSLQELRTQIHKLDVKVERILAILEQK